LRNENVVLEDAAVGAACAAAPQRQAGCRAPGTPRFRPQRAPGRGVTCPVSTEGGTRRVQLAREGEGEGGAGEGRGLRRSGPWSRA
jgi:hypothetical protein